MRSIRFKAVKYITAIWLGSVLLTCFLFSTDFRSSSDAFDPVTRLIGWFECLSSDTTLVSTTEHRLAVLIPHRDRFTELQQFLTHMDQFLNEQSVSHTFYIVNQADSYKFNRGALLNIGFIESSWLEQNGLNISYNKYSKCYQLPRTDYIALHDVDLLPIDRNLRYSWPLAYGPHHMIPAELHPRYYRYKPYFGGVMLIRRDHYKQLDGMSNSFWGWGHEDDEFRVRVKRAGMTVSEPDKVILGIQAFRSTHNQVFYNRDMQNYQKPELLARVRNPTGGLSTINYTIVNRQLLWISGVPAIVINAQLHCTLEADHCLQKNDKAHL